MFITFSEEQYLVLLVRGSHHFIVALLLVSPKNDPSCVLSYKVFRRGGDGAYVTYKGSEFMTSGFLDIPCKVRGCVV